MQYILFSFTVLSFSLFVFIYKAYLVIQVKYKNQQALFALPRQFQIIIYNANKSNLIAKYRQE